MATSSDFTERAEHLRGLGARTLTGVVSDTGGALRAKTVPLPASKASRDPGWVPR